jgi:hypothetical protein
MIELKELITYIQEILIPIAMISGIGIIALLTQTRYGRVVDITRQLNHKKLSLFRSKLLKNLVDPELKIVDNKIIIIIDRQLDLFVKRGRYLKRALMSLLAGVFLFIFTSVLILFQEIIPIVLMVPITGSLFIAGLALLVFGGACIIIDLTYSQKAVLIDLEGTKEIVETID